MSIHLKGAPNFPLKLTARKARAAADARRYATIIIAAA
jgi:hypothetical protein